MFKQYVNGKFTVWLLMASVILLPGCAGCPRENNAGEVFYGTWVDQVVQVNYLEIRRDGTFAMLVGTMPIHTGTWQIVGNEISFKLEVPGIGEMVLADGRVEDNRLIFRTVGPPAFEMIYVRR